MLAPFFWFRRNKRAHTKSCLLEMNITAYGGGHILRKKTLLLCRGTCTMISFVLIWLARAQDSGRTQTRYFSDNSRNGKNGHEQPHSVPFCPTRSNEVENALSIYQKSPYVTLQEISTCTEKIEPTLRAVLYRSSPPVYRCVPDGRCCLAEKRPTILRWQFVFSHSCSRCNYAGHGIVHLDFFCRCLGR